MAWICGICGQENVQIAWWCSGCETPYRKASPVTATPATRVSPNRVSPTKKINAIEPNNIGIDSSVSASSQEKSLTKRYWDAYLVAKVTIGIGSTIKAVGFILAALIFLGAFIFGNFAAQQSGVDNWDVSGGVFFVVLFIGGINAFIVGFVFYVIGVIVSANGQVLRATLDNTVGNSPFLTNNLKAKIMSLPEA